MRWAVVVSLALLAWHLDAPARAEEPRADCTALQAEVLRLAGRSLEVPYDTRRLKARGVPDDDITPYSGQAINHPDWYRRSDPELARDLRRLWQRDTDELACVASAFVIAAPADVVGLEGVKWRYILLVADRVADRDRRNAAILMQVALTQRLESGGSNELRWAAENALVRVQRATADRPSSKRR